MICVDIGAGFSSTIDDFVIPCPPTTVCQQNNRFECEFPPITTPAPTLPTVSYVKESIQWLDPTNPTHENIIRSTQLDTTINEAYNTISTTTIANLENDNEITTRALEKYPLGSSATKDFFWNTSPTLDETTSHYKEKRESVSTNPLTDSTTEAIPEKSTLSVQKETTDDSFIATTSLQNENIPAVISTPLSSVNDPIATLSFQTTEKNIKLSTKAESEYVSYKPTYLSNLVSTMEPATEYYTSNDNTQTPRTQYLPITTSTDSVYTTAPTIVTTIAQFIETSAITSNVLNDSNKINSENSDIKSTTKAFQVQSTLDTNKENTHDEITTPEVSLSVNQNIRPAVSVTNHVIPTDSSYVSTLAAGSTNDDKLITGISTESLSVTDKIILEGNHKQFNDVIPIITYTTTSDAFASKPMTEIDYSSMTESSLKIRADDEINPIANEVTTIMDSILVEKTKSTAYVMDDVISSTTTEDSVSQIIKSPLIFDKLNSTVSNVKSYIDFADTTTDNSNLNSVKISGSSEPIVITTPKLSTSIDATDIKNLISIDFDTTVYTTTENTLFKEKQKDKLSNRISAAIVQADAPSFETMDTTSSVPTDTSTTDKFNPYVTILDESKAFSTVSLNNVPTAIPSSIKTINTNTSTTVYNYTESTTSNVLKAQSLKTIENDLEQESSVIKNNNLQVPPQPINQSWNTTATFVTNSTTASELDTAGIVVTTEIATLTSSLSNSLKNESAFGTENDYYQKNIATFGLINAAQKVTELEQRTNGLDDEIQSTTPTIFNEIEKPVTDTIHFNEATQSYTKLYKKENKTKSEINDTPIPFSLTNNSLPAGKSTLNSTSVGQSTLDQLSSDYPDDLKQVNNVGSGLKNMNSEAVIQESQITTSQIVFDEVLGKELVLGAELSTLIGIEKPNLMRTVEDTGELQIQNSLKTIPLRSSPTSSLKIESPGLPLVGTVRDSEINGKILEVAKNDPAAEISNRKNSKDGTPTLKIFVDSQPKVRLYSEPTVSYSKSEDLTFSHYTVTEPSQKVQDFLNSAAVMDNIGNEGHKHVSLQKSDSEYNSVQIYKQPESVSTTPSILDDRNFDQILLNDEKVASTIYPDLKKATKLVKVAEIPSKGTRTIDLETITYLENKENIAKSEPTPPSKTNYEATSLNQNIDAVIENNSKLKSTIKTRVNVESNNNNDGRVNTQKLSDTEQTIASKATNSYNLKKLEATVNRENNKDKTVSTILNLSFNCQYKSRGRYGDNKDCRKFYICIGRKQPIIGRCPENTVFSEVRKQCTKNLSYCVRNNRFMCVSKGRYIDIKNNDLYYICVRNGNRTFVRYTFQCQNGYYLNKILVRCLPITSSDNVSKIVVTKVKKDKEKLAIKKSAKSESSRKNSDQSINQNNSGESDKNSELIESVCDDVGKYSDPDDCRIYYICYKNGKSEMKIKKKKCESDEVFHKKQKRCVDAESYECSTN